MLSISFRFAENFTLCSSERDYSTHKWTQTKYFILKVFEEKYE